MSNPKDLMGVMKAPLGLLPVTAKVWASIALYCGNFLSPRKDGRSGYCPYNWRHNPVKATVYIDAADRHLEAIRDGQWFDPMSPGGAVPHAAAIIADMAILLDAEAYGNLIDDRFIGPGADVIAKANEFMKAHPIPETFSWEGAGPRFCDGDEPDLPAPVVKAADYCDKCTSAYPEECAQQCPYRDPKRMRLDRIDVV